MKTPSRINHNCRVWQREEMLLLQKGNIEVFLCPGDEPLLRVGYSVLDDELEEDDWVLMPGPIYRI